MASTSTINKVYVISESFHWGENGGGGIVSVWASEQDAKRAFANLVAIYKKDYKSEGASSEISETRAEFWHDGWYDDYNHYVSLDCLSVRGGK